MLYVTEEEMIERLSDNLKKSASRADEFTRTKEEDRPKLFVDFIDGLKTSAGSAHQLAHAQENVYWLDIRNLLEQIIEVGQTLPSFSGTEPLWIKIKVSLLAMEEKSRKVYTSKAVSRQGVLADLDHRLKSLN